MSKHTPGPWEWGDDWTQDAFGNPSSEFSGKKYGDLELRRVGGGIVIPIRIDHHQVEIDHDGTPEGTIKEANRRLIAAAPDLLAVCKEIADSLRVAGKVYWNSGVHAQLETAIRKAEGAE